MSKRHKPPLTNLQKRLFAKLLCGHFLRKFTRGSKVWYVVYDAKINPVEKIREKVVRTMDKYLPLKIKLWKTDRHDNMSLNLSMVRRIDGRNPMKKLYKRRAELDSTGRIHKPRKRTKKSNEQESNLLF